MCISDFVITNPPQDATVCVNDITKCTCGYDGVNPTETIPDWIIVTKSSDGTVIKNRTIGGREIIANRHAGLRWLIGQINTTSAPNSGLLIGPVDFTHNQSSYQCVFTINQSVNGSLQSQTVRSNMGTLTVVGKRFSWYYNM